MTRWLEPLATITLLVVPFVLSARPAYSAPGDATRLEYARAVEAASCPDREALRAAVAKRLGYDPFFPVARQAIAVEIVAREQRLVANMRLVDEGGLIQGSRELTDAVGNCDELVASLALAISIALDPSAALGEARAAPAEPAAAVEAMPVAATPSNQVPAAPAPPSITGASPVRSSAPERRLRASFRAAPALSFGQLPNTAVGARLGAALRREGVEIGAEVGAWLPAARASALGGQVQARLIAASLTPCYTAARLAACALASLGQLRAEGRDLVAGTHDHSLYAALGVRLELEQELTRNFGLFLSADMTKVLSPVTFRLHEQTVWSSPAIAVITAFGVSLAIP